MPRLIIAACFGAIAFFALTAGGSNVRKFQRVLPNSIELARWVGFGLDQVSLSGNRNTFDTAIYDALRLEQAATFFGLEISPARARIEALPWVKTAAISRVFPSQLKIRITERTPVAVWQAGLGRGEASLVDASGRVLGGLPKGQNTKGLLRLMGTEAAAASQNLSALLGRHAEFQKFIRVAERVGARRWSLHLTTGSTIHLPAQGVDAALRRPKVQQLISKLGQYSNVIIDLRTPGRVSVRPQPVRQSEGVHHVL